MSANLNIKDGVVSFGYRGAAAWHGTGNQILDTDGREEIIRKCGFGFELVESSAGYVDAAGTFRAIEGKKILHRSDSGLPVAVVGDGYRAHQPGQIIDFFMDYAKTYGFRLATAGVIGNGERYWAMADTGVDGESNGNDVLKLYALLATASDGSMSTMADPVAKRVVCQNTFNIAVREFVKANRNGAKRGGRQSHRSDFSDALAAQHLGFNMETHATNFEAHLETLRALNAVRVSDDMAAEFFRTLLRPKQEEKASTLTLSALMAGAPVKAEREVRGLEGMIDAYTSAPGAKPGTARGLWEASTYFVDHVRGTDGGRFKSAQFGQGVELKDRAWKAVQDLVAA